MLILKKKIEDPVNISGIDGLDLFSKLKVLREILNEEVKIPIEVLNYIKGLDFFPNMCIAYKILLTRPVTVVTFKISFSNLKII